ncbi:hypothetical protein JCM10212_001178 [Sporobolomyces blumeae]
MDLVQQLHRQETSILVWSSRQPHWILRTFPELSGYSSFGTPVTRLARLRHDQLSQSRTIDTLRAHQDAIVSPTVETTQRRIEADRVLDRRQHLDRRLLYGREELVEEQEINRRIEELNTLLRRLEDFVGRSRAYHVEEERELARGRQLYAELKALVDAFDHLGQPTCLDPTSGRFARGGQAILFSDAACTRSYHVPFESVIKVSPMRAYGRGGLEHSKKAERKKRDRVVSLLHEIATQGWPSRTRTDSSS